MNICLIKLKSSLSLLNLSCVVFLLIITPLIVSCSDDSNNDASTIVDPLDPIDPNDFDTPDWTIETHSNDGDLNYTEVYDDNNTVRRLDIVFNSDDWQMMLDDMTEIYGPFGQGGGPGGGGFSDENPIFRPAEVYYNGIQWYKVGARFKGNSSLAFSWRNGVGKLSFKLDFDEFEDTYPQIDNQRFYGFKQLSLKNNFDDESELREKVASDIFRESGIASARVQFYEVYVDFGEGSKYFGLYTMVEEPDDTLIETQFSDDDGNLYKPDGNGASFAQGTFNPSFFEKQTNEDDSDWSDIQSVFSALHHSDRINNPIMWRQNLENVFDTETFLNYLAINTVIQNWDTYGRMTHNYYLYGNPDNQNILTWIPWDNNESLQFGKMGGSLPINFNGVSEQWPLIRFLYDDPIYREKYDGYVEDVINNAFETSYIQSKYSNYSALIQSSVVSEEDGYSFLESPIDFQNAISDLINHAQARANIVNNYLD